MTESGEWRSRREDLQDGSGTCSDALFGGTAKKTGNQVGRDEDFP